MADLMDYVVEVTLNISARSSQEVNEKLVALFEGQPVGFDVHGVYAADPEDGGW